ncbi:MAG: 16S rRNA processing protein RimM [Litorivivens sp.]|jgi:16S rRNA processing protein RimM
MAHSVGKVLKPHGYKGDLTVYVDEEIIDDYETLELLFIDHDGSDIPFKITEIAPKGKNQFKVTLLGVTDEASAKKLVGRTVAVADKHASEPEVDPIIGCTVIDEVHGVLGKVTELITIQGNNLLQVESEDNSLLIPDNENVVFEVNEEKREVRVKCPEGLIDLNL